MAEQEDDRLAGLLHPIRQCPEDILKLIFECVAHDDEDQLFMVATTLSHVCRRWRAIMLGIPSLWSQIDVSMDTDDIKDLRSFMKRVKERVGTSPVNVTIRDVVSDFTFRTNFMECMDLQYFTIITSLEYRLISSKDVLLLRGLPFTAGIGDSCVINISRIEDPHARYLSFRITIDFPKLPANQRHNFRYKTLEISSSISFSQLFS
jgi:F-box-like